MKFKIVEIFVNFLSKKGYSSRSVVVHTYYTSNFCTGFIYAMQVKIVFASSGIKCFFGEGSANLQDGRYLLILFVIIISSNYCSFQINY